MKKTYKKVIGIAFSTLFGLLLISPAIAQQRAAVSDNGGASAGSNTSSAGSGNSGNGASAQRSAPSQGAQNFNAPRNNGNNANGAQPQRNYNGNPNQFQRGNNYNNQNNNSSNYNRPQHNNQNNVGIAPQQRGFAQGQRGLTNYQNRVGIAPNNRAYRSYPGLQYGRNHITAGPRGGVYYNNRGYYRSYYMPRIGFRLRVLPMGYYPFYYGNYQYFYSGGLFYQQDNDEYTVVEPPVGASITTLPDKAQSIVINGVQYYEADGVYYQPVTKDDGTIVYVIAGKDGELNTDQVDQDAPPQVGDIVETLPDDCKKLKINGQKYYVTSDGYYLQDANDPNGKKVYKIVGTPSDEPGN